MIDYDPQPGRELPSADESTAAQSRADNHDVNVAVQGLTGLVARVDAVDALLTQIAEFAVTAAPDADGAGVTLTRPGVGEDPAVLAWGVTDPFVREVDRLQYEVVGEGPCLTAMQTRRPLVSGSLGSDDRWLRFGGRVARLQVHSALALPLIVDDRVVGALNIYARTRDAFGEHAVRLTERFAGAAAVSVANLQVLQDEHDRATELRAALTTRAVIDQAIGIVRSRSGGSADDAFDRLRQLSQAEDVKLAVVAQRIVDEAVRRVRPRPDQPPPQV